ncbi:MAG: hypothetical protein K9N05_05055 [Candidatus Marinimicrobia bacterium]|nr:hypothetical protein [Candidatus Neomarinimicrobiota bacterium]
MKKIISQSEILKALPKGEFACIKNPEGIFPEFEYAPLAKKKKYLNDIYTVVCDMDGTTTTTENLCIHSLEYMIRKISDRMELSAWAGLDQKLDYPHIIGNSTTRHVEYLIDAYRFTISDSAINMSFIKAAIWFFRYGKDPQRIEEVKTSCRIVGCEGLMAQLDLSDEELLLIYKSKCKIETKSKIVRASIDIYYQRYHEILMAIDKNEAIPMIDLIHGIDVDNLIEPMPGVAIFISLVKGWLNKEELQLLMPDLKKSYLQKSGSEIKGNMDLTSLADYFSLDPVKLALVTSSIYYEADIVIQQVFNVVQKEIAGWPLTNDKKQILISYFRDYHKIYDAFVTANDSHEIRLKPHRDLYSIALNTLHVPLEDMDKVIGLEDSESGSIAIRAAGISCVIALPFAETSGHDLSAASHIVQGGLPEVLLKHHCFMKK